MPFEPSEMAVSAPPENFSGPPLESSPHGSLRFVQDASGAGLSGSNASVGIRGCKLGPVAYIRPAVRSDVGGGT